MGVGRGIVIIVIGIGGGDNGGTFGPFGVKGQVTVHRGGEGIGMGAGRVGKPAGEGIPALGGSLGLGGGPAPGQDLFPDERASCGVEGDGDGTGGLLQLKDGLVQGGIDLRQFLHTAGGGHRADGGQGSGHHGVPVGIETGILTLRPGLHRLDGFPQHFLLALGHLHGAVGLEASLNAGDHDGGAAGPHGGDKAAGADSNHILIGAGPGKALFLGVHGQHGGFQLALLAGVKGDACPLLLEKQAGDGHGALLAAGGGIFQREVALDIAELLVGEGAIIEEDISHRSFPVAVVRVFDLTGSQIDRIAVVLCGFSLGGDRRRRTKGRAVYSDLISFAVVGIPTNHSGGKIGMGGPFGTKEAVVIGCSCAKSG